MFTVLVLALTSTPAPTQQQILDDLSARMAAPKDVAEGLLGVIEEGLELEELKYVQKA